MGLRRGVTAAALAALLGLWLASCGRPIAAPASPPASTAAASTNPSDVARISLTEVVSQAVGQDNVETVSFSPDGKQLAVGAGDGVVAIFPLDQQSGQEGLVQKLHGGFVSGLAWSPDGKLLASAAVDGTARISDASSLKPLFTLQAAPNEHPAVAWAPDGKRLALATGKDQLQIIDTSTGTATSSLTVSGATRATAWLAAGSLAASNDNGQVQFFPPSPGSSSLTFTPPSPHKSVNSLSSAAEGRLAVGYDDGAVLIVDPSSAKVTGQLPPGRQIGNVAWSPNGKLLAVSSVAFTLDVWDPSRPAPLAQENIGYDVNGLAWSPDGQYLAAGVDDHTFKIWQVSPPQPPAAGWTDPPAYMGR